MDTNETKSRKYLTMGKAAHHLQEVTGVPVSPATVWRWCAQGIRGIRLQHCKLGRRFLTTAIWLQEFMDASSRESATPPVGEATVPSIPRGDQARAPLPKRPKPPRERPAIKAAVPIIPLDYKPGAPLPRKPKPPRDRPGNKSAGLT